MPSDGFRLGFLSVEVGAADDIEEVWFCRLWRVLGDVPSMMYSDEGNTPAMSSSWFERCDSECEYRSASRVLDSLYDEHEPIEDIETFFDALAPLSSGRSMEMTCFDPASTPDVVSPRLRSSSLESQ